MAIASPPTEAKSTPRGKLRAWFEQRIEGVDELDMAAIEAEAADYFLSDREWAKGMFGRLIAQELRALLSQMRERVSLGDSATTKKGLKERADAAARRWGAWVEHTPQGYVRLMAMTRSQLLAAASERETRGLTEYRTARLWRDMAAKLKNDEQMVREHFSPVQIEKLEQRILQEEV